MAHPIITLLPWVPPLVPHIIPPRYITGELMPSLVICDGVHATHVDILLKRTIAVVATGALVRSLHPTHLLTCAWSSWVVLN